MLHNITPGLYRTHDGGVAQVERLGKDANGRLMGFGRMSPKRGKPSDESWYADYGTHFKKPEYSLKERVSTIGESRQGG